MTISQKINILEWAYPDHFDYCLMELVDDILLFTDNMGWRTELLSTPFPSDALPGNSPGSEMVAMCRIWVDPSNPTDLPVLYKGRGSSRFEAAITALCNLTLDLPNTARGQL